MVSTAEQSDLWTLVRGTPSIDPEALCAAMERECQSASHDFRTRLLLRDAYTALGRRILFVGRGREVARLSGINTDRIRIACLVASGFLGALAGVLYAGTQGAADPVSGVSYQLPALAAAFLGARLLGRHRLLARLLFGSGLTRALLR